MKQAIVAALLVASATTVGCGSKQATSQAVAGAGEAPLVVRGDRDLPIARDGVLLAADGVNRQANISYGLKPALVFRLTETTVMQIEIASTGNADLAMMIVGPSLPMMNDDFRGLDPGIVAELEPGTYRVYVGAWGELPNRAAYTLSAVVADEEALSSYNAGNRVEERGDHRYPSVAGEERPLNVEAAPLSGSVQALTTGTITATARANATATAQPYSVHAANGAYCAGLVHADAPAAVFDLPEAGIVTIKVRAPEDPSADTVLVAADDNGNLYCNDDFDGLNAGVMLDAASASRLSVFVGTYSGSAEPVDFQIEAELQVPSNEPPVSMTYRAGGGAQHMLVKEAMMVPLSTLGSGCVGYSRSVGTPHAIVDVRERGASLEFLAASSADSTIAVQTPSGETLCNDDYQGLDAGVVVSSTEVGEYRVWLGTYQSAVKTAISLSVTPSEVVRAGRGTRRGPVATSNVQSMNVKAGGNDLGSSADIRCQGGAMGYFDLSQPSAVFEVKEGEGLALRGEADFDTSLIIRNADGSYACADDELGTAPAAYFQAIPGDVFVWTGVFRESDKGQTMKLFYQIVSEHSDTPPEIFRGLLD